MDDAALVEAARAGDGGAWAAIYDRYADRLHDHCHRILRDRDEAADALHDAFISASRHLDQLRDPARLRPWLYSICRHEALRRARRRDRIELTPEVGEVTGVDAEMDRGTRSAELQELVWAAAAGLNPRDQALLDLNLRQGLEGQDLADAMGTSLSNSYVMLSRLRDQVERSLGSLLIARLGREDCDELDRLLSGWDGRFSPLLRKRVARHVDGCDVCRERRSVVASPIALLAAAPLVPAPSMLRDRVLSGIGSDTPAPPVRFTRGGFAAIETTRRSPGPRRLAAAAVVVLIALVAGVLAVTSGDDGEVPVAAIAASTTSTTVEAIATTTTTLAETTTTTQSTTTTTTAPAVATPTTQPAAPPSTEDPGVTPPTSGHDPALDLVACQPVRRDLRHLSRVLHAAEADADHRDDRWRDGGGAPLDRTRAGRLEADVGERLDLVRSARPLRADLRRRDHLHGRGDRRRRQHRHPVPHHRPPGLRPMTR
jgi:RNA polymerase sigma factor (sigma-70 family)